MIYIQLLLAVCWAVLYKISQIQLLIFSVFPISVNDNVIFHVITLKTLELSSTCLFYTHYIQSIGKLNFSLYSSVWRYGHISTFTATTLVHAVTISRWITITGLLVSSLNLLDGMHVILEHRKEFKWLFLISSKDSTLPVLFLRYSRVLNSLSTKDYLRHEGSSAPGFIEI